MMLKPTAESLDSCMIPAPFCKTEMRFLSLSRLGRDEILSMGIPWHSSSKLDGLAHFAKVNPSKLKYLYKYAGDMELTFGEFMFDFMLDMENDSEKLTSFFK